MKPVEDADTTSVVRIFTLGFSNIYFPLNVAECYMSCLEQGFKTVLIIKS